MTVVEATLQDLDVHDYVIDIIEARRFDDGDTTMVCGSSFIFPSMYLV